MPALDKQLTRRKCERILRFYKNPFSRTEQLSILRKKTKDILNDKMCKCVNALYKGTAAISSSSSSSSSKDLHAYEDSIAICKRSVYGRKGLTPPRFTCKKRNR